MKYVLIRNLLYGTDDAHTKRAAFSTNCVIMLPKDKIAFLEVY